ncbi:MAG: MBL fold metallo-hydrolase [Chlamydiota bacterium]
MFFFKFPSGPLNTNAILLGCIQTKKSVVIDPSPGSAESLLHKSAEQGWQIEKILLTHSHWDHFADAHLLKNKLGVPLYVHPLDAKNLEHPGSDGLPLFIPIQPVTPDHFLQEGDILEVGQLRLEVIHTPGHSPGGVCFHLNGQLSAIPVQQARVKRALYPFAARNLPPFTGAENLLPCRKEFFKEQILLFSGDTLFRGGIGNLHLPTGNASQMRKSLEKLARLPPKTHVVPGHGDDTTIGRESGQKIF